MLEAPGRFSISRLDQPAQALPTDGIDIALEVRIQEFEHPAARLRKMIVASGSRGRVPWQVLLPQKTTFRRKGILVPG